MVTYRGDPAITYYFSTSGGQTENSEFGFSGGSAIPYLKSVDDPFDDASPVHTWTETLSDDEMSRFYRALKDVIARGVRQVEEHLPPELGTKIRNHMKVRGHKGKPCPRCGTPILKTRHGLDDMFLCPRCQPPPKGQIR